MKIVVTTAGPEPPARLYGLVLIREKFIMVRCKNGDEP